MARDRSHWSGLHCLNKLERLRAKNQGARDGRGAGWCNSLCFGGCCQRFGRRRTPASLEAWEKRLVQGPRPRPGQTKQAGRVGELLPRHCHGTQ